MLTENQINAAAHALAMEYVKRIVQDGGLSYSGKDGEEITYQQYAKTYLNAYQGIANHLRQN